MAREASGHESISIPDIARVRAVHQSRRPRPQLVVPESLSTPPSAVNVGRLNRGLVGPRGQRQAELGDEVTPSLAVRSSSSSGTPAHASRIERRSRRDFAPPLGTVDIPGIGYLNRRQLRRLRDTIDGRATSSIDVMDLPDLTSLSSWQMRVLESALDDIPDDEEDEPVGNSTAVENSRPQSGASSSGHRRERVVSISERTREQEVAAVASIPPRVRERARERRPQSGSSITYDDEGEEGGRWLPDVGQMSRRQEEQLEDAITEAMLDVPTGSLDEAQEGPERGQQWRVCDIVFKTLSGKNIPADSECAVCFQAFDGDKVDKVALPCSKKGCSSFFHADCIRPWLEKNPNCPLCRAGMKQLVRPATPDPSPMANPMDSGVLLLAALGRGDAVAVQQPINRAYAFLLHHRERMPNSALAGGDVLFNTIERLVTRVPSSVDLQQPLRGSQLPSGTPGDDAPRVASRRSTTVRQEVAAARAHLAMASMSTLQGDAVGRMNRALQSVPAMEATIAASRVRSRPGLAGVDIGTSASSPLAASRAASVPHFGAVESRSR